MRAEGLEPPRLSPPAPKAGVSTGSTTPAGRLPHGDRAPRIIPQLMGAAERAAQADRERRNVVIERPNRAKAASKATKAIIILLLLASVGLMGIVCVGGWTALEGAKPILIAYMAIYLILAFYCARWNRGVLPLAAAFGIILLIFAAIAGPEWFARDKTGFSTPPLDEGILGLITLLLIPVELLLIAFAMRGFQQEWNVEVERPADGSRPDQEDEDDYGAQPAQA